MKIVISGFEPFLSHSNNPTKRMIEDLPDNFNGIKIVTKLLPVEYDNSFYSLKKIVDIEQPDFVIMLGLAGNRSIISLERIAINMDHARGKDNNGVIRTHQTISKHGKNAYFSTLPIVTMYHRLTENKIPCEISNSAGTYVCNNTFYHMMEHIEKHKLPIRAGFIHVPQMKELVGDNGDSLDESVLMKALKEIIITCMNESERVEWV